MPERTRRTSRSEMPEVTTLSSSSLRAFGAAPAGVPVARAVGGLRLRREGSGDVMVKLGGGG